MATGRHGLFAELKRRHVWRVAVAYVVVAWLLLQLASIVLPTFGAPDWVLKVLIAVFVLLFPVALILAWAFEMTPEGVRRTEPAHSPEAREAHDTHAVGRKLNSIIIGVLVVAVVLLVANTFIWHKGARSATGPATGVNLAQSIAVLPFENLSTDKANAYFADGMQDLILTKLADIGSLKVISRTSTEKYKSRPDNLKQVAAELGVATILEGSVQKAGDEVLVNVQLIDAQTDAHIWAQTYQRKLDDIFGVEGEVAGKIAGSLSAKLSPAQRTQLAAVPTRDPVAWDAFLRAEYLHHQADINGDSANAKAAIPLYRKAVAADPKFALAWARLSKVESHLVLKNDGNEDVQQLERQAQADADSALALQPDLPAAQLALGYCAYWGRNDYDTALKAFATVLAARPDDADALVAQAYVARRLGRFDEAIASLTRVVALDPRNFTPTYELGVTFANVGRYAEAETWYRRALALEPESIQAKIQYSNAILFGSGDIPRALAVVQGDAPDLKFQRVSLLDVQRKFGAEIALEQTIPDTSDISSASRAGSIARTYWEAGDKARAQALFAQALPQDRARIASTRGINQAFVWIAVAYDELGTGHAAEALAAASKSEAIVADSHDPMLAAAYSQIHAGFYAQAGRGDLAVPLLAKGLAAPGIGFYYSPLMLWLDPCWDPIRDDPGFQALLQEYAQYKPAVIPVAPAASTGTAP